MTIARMTRIVVTVILWMISAIMPVVAAPTDEAAALGRKAHEFSRAGKYADAIPLAERALALREKVLGPNHPDVALSLNNLAQLYKDQGRYSDAEPLYQRSLAIREKALGRDHPDVAQSLNNLAVLYDARSLCGRRAFVPAIIGHSGKGARSRSSRCRSIAEQSGLAVCQTKAATPMPSRCTSDHWPYRRRRSVGIIPMSQRR